MALQGHPRSLILAPIESVYATSYWSSIVTLVISCPVSEILQLGFLVRTTPPIFHPNFRVVSLGLDYPKLIIRVINFELVHYVHRAVIIVELILSEGRKTSVYYLYRFW